MRRSGRRRAEAPRVTGGLGASVTVAIQATTQTATGLARARVGRNRSPLRRRDVDPLGCRRADALDLGLLSDGHDQRVERQHVRSREPGGAGPDDGHMEGLPVAALSRVTRT